MTSLATGERVSKSNLRLEAYGTADELNSHVGMLRAMLQHAPGDWVQAVDQELRWVQNRLFDVGAILAASDLPFEEDNVSRLEEWMDKKQDELPILRAFILPGGNQVVSELHICRCVSRRLERHMVAWQESSGESLPESVNKYMNRLSDYFFVLARYAALKMEINPSIWEK